MKGISLRSPLAVLCLGVLLSSPACAQNYGARQQYELPKQPVASPESRAKVHTELGAAYFQAGNPSVALDELKTAIDDDSNYVQAYSVRGLVYASLKEYAKAERDFQKALSIAPQNPDVNNNYGWFLCQTGKEKESISYFLAAVRDPLYDTPSRAYTNAGTCAMKAGDLDAAQKYLLQALQTARDGAVQARLQLAELLFRRGVFEEAGNYLNEAIRQMSPPTAEALWLGLRLERKLGDRVAEKSYASQLRSRYPASPEYQEFLKGNFQ